MSSRTSGDGEARLNQNDPSDSDAVAPPSASAEANEGIPHEQEVEATAMASEDNSEKREKLADLGDMASAPEPRSEEASDKTGDEDMQQTEPSSENVQAPPMGAVDGSLPQSEAQRDESLGEGEEDVPAPTDERYPGGEGEGSAPAVGTEELRKASDEGEEPPSTLLPPSGGGGGEGESSGSTAEDPQTGTQDSSDNGGPEQTSGAGAEGGLDEPAATPSAGRQSGGEGEVGGEQTEVKETAGEETVQGGEKERGVGSTPQHGSGDEKGNEPSAGKVDGEEEEKEMDGETPGPGGTDAGADAGESDGLEVEKGTAGGEASPQGKEGGVEGPGEQVESKNAPVSEQGEKGEAQQSAETGPGSGDMVEQEGLTASGEEGTEGGQRGKVGQEEAAQLPDDFFYDYDLLVSKPEVVDLLPSVLSLQYPLSSCEGAVEAMYLEEGELITAGADGFVKVWDYETIDNADITEDSSVFEMEPLTEIRVGSSVSIKSLVRSTDPDTPTLWYAQDANGAIWKVDVIVSHTRRSPERMMQFPSGAITGMGVSAKERLVGVISEDGGVAVYNYEVREDVCRSKFTGGGASLIWAPQQVDADSRTILTGFGDGVVRVLVMEESDPSQVSAGRRLAPTLTLAHVCKPHSSAVVGLAVDPRGELLATGSKDGTVFFLSIKEGYDPIGFIQTPAPVTSLMWSQDDSVDQKLLVCCEEGSMLEVDAPKKDMFDTSKTYYLDPLKFTCTKFQTVKDKIKKAEEDARKAAEKAKKQKLREERLLKKREEEGEEAELSEEEEEEEEEGEEAAEGQEEEGKPKGPSPVLKGFYYGAGREFWLSMGGYDAGFLYQYSMVDKEVGQTVEPSEPKEAVPLPSIAGKDVPLTALTFSHSGSYMLVGAENGNVRVFPLRESATTPGQYDIGNFKSHWTLCVHDNQYGRVTHICCSHDDKYILTAGHDGNVFVFQASLEAGLKKKEAEHLGDTKSVLDLTREVKDIEDPNAYSIEDAKQKAEHDRRMKAAEEKKQSVRHEILGLRKQFQRLVNKARQLPEHLQLPKEEFIMDPDMESTLQQQLLEKVDLLHKEMAWEAEKCSLARKKLHDRFKAVVDTDHFVVKTFDRRVSVSSYRTPVPSDTYLEMLQEYRTLLASSRATTADTLATRPGTSAVEHLHGEGEPLGRKDLPGMLKARPARMSKAMEKAEARRIKKMARQKQWAELMAGQPDEKSDDPKDLATYRHAERTIGDYKLKSGSDYVVPEDQRVTATKKRHQLLVLRHEILTRKAAFNSQLMSLRERKKQLIGQVEELTQSLEVVQAKLPPALRRPVPPVPTLDKDELPEQTLEYTKESLLELKVQLAAREEAERMAKVGGDDFGGFGGFGGGGTQPPDGEKKEGAEPLEEEEGRVEPAKEGQEGGEGEEELEIPASAEGSLGSLEEDGTQHLSLAERLLTEEMNIKYLYEATHLLDRISLIKKEFDSDLCWLRHDKMSLDVQMKMADLRHISLFEELELLKEFEKRETTYTNRYTTKKQEKREMETKMSQSKQLVQSKEKEVTRLLGEEKALESSFLEKVEENKFKDFLVRVFKKKIKRVKKEVKTGGSDDEDSDGDDSDSDYTSSEEEGEEGEGALDDTVCPPGCDEALFSLACELREKRLDLEDALAEEKKQLEMTKKEMESLKKKAKVMEAGVKTAHSEMQAFQFEKQQKLNELDQVVVLKLSQILHFGRGATPPTNLKPCLVFLASERQRLQRRISELHVEKQQEAKHFAELKQKHVKLARDRKMMVAKVQELQAAADHAMMLKFGRIVDLDRLEGLHINKTAEDLRMKIEAVERRRVQAVLDLEGSIEQSKTQYLEVLKENTRRLNKVSELQHSKKELEKRLNARQKAMAAPYTGQFFDANERQRLTGLVDYQAQEVEALKEEIQMLQLKGSHVLPPMQPPVPTGAHR